MTQDLFIMFTMDHYPPERIQPGVSEKVKKFSLDWHENRINKSVFKSVLWSGLQS